MVTATEIVIGEGVDILPVLQVPRQCPLVLSVKADYTTESAKNV